MVQATQPNAVSKGMSCLAICAAVFTVIAALLALMVYISGEDSMVGFLDRYFPDSRRAIPAPQNAGATIEQVIVENYAIWSSKEGAIIHVRFTTTNLENVKSRLAAHFYDATGQALKDFNNTYADIGGNVSLGEVFIPRYQQTGYTDVPLFIPYDELHLAPGTYQLKVTVGVYVVYDNRWLVISDPVDFVVSIPAKERK